MGLQHRSYFWGTKYSQCSSKTSLHHYISPTSSNQLITWIKWCIWYWKAQFSSAFLKWTISCYKKRGEKKAHATATGNSHLMQNKLSHYATDQRRKICPIAIIIALHVLTVFNVLGRKQGFRYPLSIQISLSSILKPFPFLKITPYIHKQSPLYGFGFYTVNSNASVNFASTQVIHFPGTT